MFGCCTLTSPTVYEHMIRVCDYFQCVHLYCPAVNRSVQRPRRRSSVLHRPTVCREKEACDARYQRLGGPKTTPVCVSGQQNRYTGAPRTTLNVSCVCISCIVGVNEAVIHALIPTSLQPSPN